MNKVIANPDYYGKKLMEHLLYHLLVEQITWSGLNTLDLVTKHRDEFNGLVRKAAEELRDKNPVENGDHASFAS